MDYFPGAKNRAGGLRGDSLPHPLTQRSNPLGSGATLGDNPIHLRINKKTYQPSAYGTLEKIMSSQTLKLPSLDVDLRIDNTMILTLNDYITDFLLITFSHSTLTYLLTY